VSHELEAAAADSVGGFFSRKPRHALPVGTPCPNCETPLEGPWCHQCGQKGEEFHRSIGHLVTEAFEGLTHFDGRFWQTMPDLAWRPGKLTRAYLDGRRAPQIPPFRLFLVVVLLVFFTGGLGGRDDSQILKADGETRILAGPGLRPGVENRVAPAIDLDLGKSNAGATQAAESWLEHRLKAAMEDPAAFGHALEAWGHRLAILALPIAAGLLGLLFVFQRRFFLYDHLIFSMHSLSFQGLLLSASFLVNLAPGKLGDLLLLAMPVHLFMHMRGVYGTGVLGTLARMLLLFVGSVFGGGLIMILLFFLGLNAVGAHG
jgi:hypothetical protein